MLQTWRWFGPSDPITLNKIAQTGATGIVSSLHDVPTGEAWPYEKILEQKNMIEAEGLTWDVVESVPVHNDIKSGSGDAARMIENYKTSLLNLGRAGITTVCYNFMPVVDWTRTDLDFDMPHGKSGLRFDMATFAAYDIYILKRENAESAYPAHIVERAAKVIEVLTDEQKEKLEKNIIAGLPGGEGSYTRDSIRAAIQTFIDLGEDGLRGNLLHFLEEVVPVAESSGVDLCIHPDDPPFSLFGLPRVVSTVEDLREIFQKVESVANGLTLCAGSLGARGDNDLTAIAKEFGPRVHFVHLRNVKREDDGSFYESDHLEGDNDLVSLISALLSEETDRKSNGRARCQIAMRPDHGHELGDEVGDPNSKPGYSYLGRLKGLAELRGVITALSYQR